MSGRDDPAAALTLQAWLSPGYPVGAYSFSGGLETAVAENAVVDGRDLREFLEAYLEDGPGWSDALLLAEAHRAVSAGDLPRLAAVSELAAVFGPAQERRLETRAQGAAFLRVTLAAYPPPPLAAGALRGAEALGGAGASGGLEARGAAVSAGEALAAALGEAPAYPVALGAFAGAHRAPLALALPLFLQAVAANLVSAAIRLAILGQTEGQRLLADLAPRIAGQGALALQADLNDLGGAMARGDLWSMRHETQETRLFRS